MKGDYLLHAIFAYKGENRLIKADYYYYTCIVKPMVRHEISSNHTIKCRPLCCEDEGLFTKVSAGNGIFETHFLYTWVWIEN